MLSVEQIATNVMKLVLLKVSHEICYNDVFNSVTVSLPVCDWAKPMGWMKQGPIANCAML